jgi:hypothetical protein
LADERTVDMGKRKPRIIVDEDDLDACWEWQGATANGYPQLTVNYRHVRVHRLSFETWVGPIPAGIQIDHTCHTPTCCNPRHLRLATCKQNGENHNQANRNSRSGVRGVWWYPRYQKWVAKVRHNYELMHVGYFDSLAEAEAAVIAKRNELFTFNDADRR